MSNQAKKFHIVTLGCRTNQYETGAYAHQLQDLGWKPTSEGERADVCVVNTCTVTASADSHSRHAIRQLKRDHPEAQIWVTGCLAERDPEGVRSIEGVTAVVSNLEKEFLVNYMLPEADVPEFNIETFEGHTRAFVKVQDGCNSFCSYCVIPYVRGRSRSKTVDEVLKEVEQLVANGYKEIVLTGINIGDFDGQKPGEIRLVDLVREVDAIEGVKRLRLSSIDPDEVDQDLQDAILKGRSTCPSLHIVLQSGSNFILKRMGRKYTRQIFLDTCQRLRAECPDFGFTTDVIVGFPGESDYDFRQTLEVIEQTRFSKVHMFPFSARPQTKAARFTDTVDPKVISQRKSELLHASEQHAFELRQQYLEREMVILTEQAEALGCEGHTHNFIKVKVPGLEKAPNEFIRVKIIGNEATGLIGELV
jgi:threonylcarbamoyladenosine tRNA methylthiotransferase MtaB